MSIAFTTVVRERGSIHRYLDGQWILQAASGGLDVSVTAPGASGATLTYLRDSNTFSYSNAGGGGVIVHQNSAITETFAGGSVVHRTSRLGGTTGFFNDLTVCHDPTIFAGTAQFYSFSSNRFLVGDPTGCDRLRIPNNETNYASSPYVFKVAAGNRGPGNDRIWALTNMGRVIALDD